MIPGCVYVCITGLLPRCSLQVLLDAGIKSTDAVVLGSGPPAGAELEADARILAAVLQVSNLVVQGFVDASAAGSFTTLCSPGELLV